MQVFKLKENYKHSELLYRNSTSELFYYEGDIARFTDMEEKTYKELAKLIQLGKIVIFPICKMQKMDNIRGYIYYGFDIYFMQYKDYSDWSKWYMENCVELVIEEEKIEERQQELPF